MTASNLFAVFPAQSVRIAIDLVQENLKLFNLYQGSVLGTEVRDHIILVLVFFSSLVLVFALIKGAFMYVMRQTLIVMSRHIEYDLKNEIFSHYQKLSMSFYRKNNTGDMMARIAEDVSRVRMFIGPVIMYGINLVVTIVLVLWAMFSVNVKLSLYVLIPLPILSYMIFYVNNIIHQRSDAIQSQLSKVTSFVQEAYSGLRVIKSFAVENFSREDFENYADDYRNRSLDLAKVDATFFPLMVFLTGMSTLITIFAGGLLVISGEISIGNIAEFVIYVNMLTWPVTSLGFISSLTQRAAASQSRINEFLEVEPEIVSDDLASFHFEKEIEFRNVSFRYEGKTEYALKDISFTVNKGESLAILGTTGSGKSTIAQLILRMMDATEGQILIDGKDIRDINTKDFTEQIGYVPQDVFLFSDSIANNISFGLKTEKSVTKERLNEAAKNAALLSTINDFPQGFETVIGERGVTLSGGQKQRISIARALIKDPDILILDDCLSALDNKTETEILNNLRSIMKEKTSFIISHRVSSVKDAGVIIMLENGSICESGNHEQLMSENGRYAKLYQSQLFEESVS